ncbi:Elongator complex protein 2 [Chionoecetes opilio]|uniref:Elongator complex protein 2 n=1 Tax=Chionoecetes opilio TaxID=41210 RepID=A0A8J4YUL1_CHIOP|nr:Elongator complex protein 2 [Chionoecetes opilio]
MPAVGACSGAMKVHTEYLSSGVNQMRLGMDWGTDGTVCYAANTGVLLYDPQLRAVTGASSKHHTKRVTCVRWVQSTEEGSHMIVSGGADGKAVLWTVSGERTEGLHVLSPLSILDHGDAVNLVDATVLKVKGKDAVLVVTATTDFITTWLVCHESGTHEQLHSSAPPGNVFPLSLRLFEVPGAKFPVLLFGGHDSRIHILAARELGVYHSVCRLCGHEDWVTSLAVMKEDEGGLLLASGSKDATVRLWKLSIIRDRSQQEEEDASSQELKLKSITFEIPSACEDLVMCALLDAVLAGHEGLVSEVCWAKPSLQGNYGCHIDADDKLQAAYKLLTCSKTQDRCIIIWEPNGDTTSSMWLEVARLGEVGGNMEGYYSCQFNSDGSKVLGCSYQGGLHLWEQQDSVWEPRVVAGGHFDQVADLAWDPRGRYLLSVSKDQTTRLHGGWKTGNKVLWHEVSRPQVHGYDMACVTTLGKYKFASGSEEKVIRAFTAPANFIRNFGNICGFEVEEDIAQCEVGEGAAVPSLGLSNKAVTAADLQQEYQVQAQGKEEVQAYFKPLALSAPPTEDQLMQNTLWPETSKLYGHGNDIFAIAASSDGSILASACRAANNIDAAIILWNTTTWHKLDTLAKHRLTVTQLAFSPDDQYLLSISRDRTWAVFVRAVNDKGVTYRLYESVTKKETMHSRVIWSCAWLPDSTHFVTASRDKTVAVWGLTESAWCRKALLNESDEVTAVAVTTLHASQCVLIATGLVGGDVHLIRYNPTESTFSSEVMKVTHKHHDSVRRLEFRPTLQGTPDVSYLASCSSDNRVHIYRINITKST